MENKKTGIYGPNSEHVGALVKKWENLSRAELESFAYAVSSAGNSGAQDSSDRDSLANQGGPENDVLQKAWLALRELARDAARTAASAAGRGESLDAALDAVESVVSDDAWSVIRRLLNALRCATREEWEAAHAKFTDEVSPLNASRFCVISFVKDAACTLVVWDLATEDGPYTIAQRDILYEPWRKMAERFGHG